MERNWLIRTYHKQILGPVSKQKLLEFIQKGSVGVTDEVTSGNGYWFSLKEKELVEKYLHGDIPQSFNPVSESKSVLIYRKNKDKTTSFNSASPNNRITDKAASGDVHLPVEEDLEYPDMEQITSEVANSVDATQINAQLIEHPDITLIAHPPAMPDSLRAKKDEEIVAVSAFENPGIQLFPDTEDLEYPDMLGASEPIVPQEVKKEEKKEEKKKEKKEEIVIKFDVIEEEVSKTIPEVAKKQRSEKKAKSTLELDTAPMVEPAQPIPVKRAVSKELEKRNDNYLFVIFFVLLIILFGIFYYYREILNKPLPI